MDHLLLLALGIIQGLRSRSAIAEATFSKYVSHLHFDDNLQCLTRSTTLLDTFSFSCSTCYWCSPLQARLPRRWNNCGTTPLP